MLLEGQRDDKPYINFKEFLSGKSPTPIVRTFYVIFK